MRACTQRQRGVRTVRFKSHCARSSLQDGGRSQDVCGCVLDALQRNCRVAEDRTANRGGRGRDSAQKGAGASEPFLPKLSFSAAEAKAKESALLCCACGVAGDSSETKPKSLSLDSTSAQPGNCGGSQQGKRKIHGRGRLLAAEPHHFLQCVPKTYSLTKTQYADRQTAGL